MQLESKLASLPPSQWRTGRAIAFDWYDGPRSGVCRLAAPECEFQFELLDERYNPDGLDDRLFRLSELPAGSVATIEAAFNDSGLVGQPGEPLWVPVWRFSNAADRQRVEAVIEQVLASRRPTALVVISQDMIEFGGQWDVNGREPEGARWFEMLGIGR